MFSLKTHTPSVVPVRFQQMPFTIIIPEDSENRKYVCVLWSGEIDVNLSVTISTLDFTAEGKSY